MGEPRSAHGFSLLELMVVVGIAAIMMAVAIPSFQRYRTTEYAKSNAANIASVLRDTRQRAMKEGNQYIVVFNPQVTTGTGATPTGTLLRVVQDTDRNCVPAAAEPGTNVSFIVDPGGIVRAYNKATDPYNVVAQPDNLGSTLNNVNNGGTFPPLTVAPYGTGGGSVQSVCFNGRGLPVDSAGNIASTGGAFYVSDTRQAVFAAVLNPLGEVRLRALGGQGVWQ